MEDLINILNQHNISFDVSHTHDLLIRRSDVNYELRQDVTNAGGHIYHLDTLVVVHNQQKQQA